MGALGLAGAALLGCRAGGGSTAGGAPESAKVAAAKGGVGLPMTAPVVQGKPRYGGVWTVPLLSTPVQFDSHTALGGIIWHKGVSERTLEPDPVTGAVRPHVATSWEIADKEGLTLLFKIHPKLYLHNIAPFNGRQFTAADVAWNMERIGGLYADRLKIPKSGFQRATMVQNIVKAEAVDPLTVKVTLSRPNSAFFNGLMENRVPLMPKEMDDIGFSDPLKMAGIGAYQVTEWVKDQKTAFKKNPRYAEFRPGEPYFDEFREIVVPDTAAQQAAFISGQTQYLSGETQQSIDLIRKQKPDANLYAWVDGNWDYFRPSLDFGPFKDFRVRKAMSLAIDYQAINDGYYGPGWGYQASLSPGFPEGWQPDKVKTLPGYNPSTKTADRAEAQKMMAAAGFPNGKGITIGVLFNRTSDYAVSHVTFLQGQMANVFPEMKIEQRGVDSAGFTAPLAEGKFDLVDYTNTVVPDAVLEMTSQYHSQGSRNYGHGNFPAIDTLVEKALGELNRDARTKLLEEFQQRFHDEWMLSFVLNARPARRIVAGNVGGYDKVAGFWNQYSSNAQVGRWYYVEK
ncbi:MAG: ABC transporter substrate-binding protein [Chloroflexi bacterium]|nr:MAG: ABC transporter substrate-binding protein [Chloroflexota bacterium]